ncbi:MAG: tetratricopeptide repeat protein [Terriglobia bacterium]
MKKETLITALVFLGAGFLGGYVYSARRVSASRPAAGAIPSATASPQSTAGDGSNGDLSSELPKGHPRLSDAEVIQFFKDAAAHNPVDLAPRLKLANFLFDRKRFAEAIPWYQQVLERSPRDVDARTDMATCYFNLGEPRQALDELHRALRIDPRHQATLFNLVVVNLEGAHDVRAAEKAWRQLDAVNPNYPNIERLKALLNQAATGSRQPAG